MTSINENYWRKHWEDVGFGIITKSHPLRVWIEKEIPKTNTATCIEIGCYPGKFLSLFGEMGYQLNGVDFFPNTNDLKEYFKNRNYRCGNFYEIDFMRFSPEETYDLVASFGFIEHFDNWQNIVTKHIDLSKKNGSIILDVPNLSSPLYYLLYRILEPEVIDNHVLSAMNLNSIKQVFIKNKCSLNYSNYVGHFYFRFVTKHNKFYKMIEKVINFFAPIFELLPNSIHKRYIGIIATKKF